MRDRLFILETGFEDPSFPDQLFYCWHCVLMEGLLASFPDMAEQIDVRRVSWPRPRTDLIDLLGIDNQSLPVLILAQTPPEDIQFKTHNGLLFIDDKDMILMALSRLYDIPVPHP